VAAVWGNHETNWNGASLPGAASVRAWGESPQREPISPLLANRFQDVHDAVLGQAIAATVHDDDEGESDVSQALHEDTLAVEDRVRAADEVLADEANWS